MTHFALRDGAESALAVLLFLPLFAVPGFLAGYGMDLAEFRRRTLMHRAAWSIALSFGIVPFLLVAVSSLGGLRAAAGVYYLLAGLGLWILLRAHRSGALRRPADRASRWAVGACLFWCAAAILQLIDLQWGRQLFVSVTVRDHCYRVAFIESVLRSGVPPTNPLYDTGQPALMRNYYYWYVVCAAVCKATGLLARNVLVASCAWAGLGMFAAAALFCRHFLPRTANPRRTALTSIFLFGVTGLDILMVIYLHLSTSYHRWDADMEWWDPDHYPSWLDSFLYVPHHVAGLVCCLLALLVLWTGRLETAPVRRWAGVAVAALAFSGAFGLSIYVAFALAITVLIWAVTLLFARQLRLVVDITVAGAASVVLLLPFLFQLRGETASSGSKKSFPLTLQLRQLYGLREWSEALTAAHPWLAHHVKLLRTLLWFVLAVPDSTLELGLFGLCGVLAFLLWRRGALRGHDGMRTLLILTGGSLFSTVALRSSITTINDYGFRTAMLPLFLLLVLTAFLLSEGLLARFTAARSGAPLFPLPLRAAAAAALFLGAVGTVYQAVGIRVFLPLYEHGRLRDHRTNGAFPRMSRRVYEAREAYAELARLAPEDAVAQYNPASIGSYFLYVNMLNVGRQVVSAEPGCGKSFGGDEGACPLIEASLGALYGDAPLNLPSALSLCRSLGIQYLLVSDQDPAWQDSASWVWSAAAVVEKPGIRILSCK